MNEDSKRILHIIIKFYREHNQFPRIAYIQKTAQVSGNQTRLYLKKLQSYGYLHLNYNHYEFTQKFKDYVKELDEKKKVTGVSKQVTSEVASKIIKKGFNYINILRLTLILISIGASILSIYYTTIWSLGFLSLFLAILSSSIMILFSLIVFEVAIILWKRSQYVLAIICAFLWIVIIIFSITTTIAGQYNNRTIEFIKNKKNNTEHDLILKQISDIDKDIEMLLEELKVAKSERDSFMLILNEFDTLEKRKDNWKIYWNNLDKLDESKSQIDQINSDISAKKLEKRKLENKNYEVVSKNENKRTDFYDWIGTMFVLDSRKLEFWVSLFPAIFIDIIAPLALALGLFLTNKEIKND